MSLSSDEKSYIEKHLYSYEQNWKIDTLIMGEPSVENECLVYDSGDDISICLYPFNLNSFDMAYFDKYFKRLKNNQIRTLKFYGYEEFINRLPRTGAYALYYNSSALRFELDMTYQSPTPKAWQSYRAALKRNYSFICSSIDYVNREMIELLTDFICTKDLDSVDEVYFLMLSLFCSRMDILIAKVECDSKLIGFALIHQFSEEKYILLMAFMNHQYKYVSDYMMGSLYYQFIASCENRKLLLGIANTPGLIQFKRKWALPNKADSLDTIMYSNHPDDLNDLGIWWYRIVRDWYRHSRL